MKNSVKILSLFLIFTFLFTNIIAIESNGKIICNDSVDLEDTIEVTFDIGQYIGAYDSYSINYNSNLLELVSVDKDLTSKYWFDNSKDQQGIKTVTYVFKAKKNGMATIEFNLKGGVSSDEKLEELDDIHVSKEIKVGTGILAGDLDKNNIIDSKDASLALDIFKRGTATTEELEIGDVDGNGVIDSKDASAILDIFKNGV